MVKKKIIYWLIVLVILVAPGGIAGVRYYDDISSIMSKKEMLDGLKIEKVEKKLTIRFIPSSMTDGEGENKVYQYTPKKVTDESGYKYNVGMLFSFDQEITDQYIKDDYVADAKVLKIRIPDAIANDSALMKKYGVNAVKKKDGYYVFVAYEVNVNGTTYDSSIFNSTYEYTDLKEIVESDNPVKTIKEKYYEQYSSNEEYWAKSTAKKWVKYGLIFDVFVLGLATVFYKKKICRGGDFNS